MSLLVGLYSSTNSSVVENPAIETSEITTLFAVEALASGVLTTNRIASVEKTKRVMTLDRRECI